MYPSLLMFYVSISFFPPEHLRHNRASHDVVLQSLLHMLMSSQSVLHYFIIFLTQSKAFTYINSVSLYFLLFLIAYSDIFIFAMVIVILWILGLSWVSEIVTDTTSAGLLLFCSVFFRSNWQKLNMQNLHEY